LQLFEAMSRFAALVKLNPEAGKGQPHLKHM